MGYFPNGTSGDIYEEEYCSRCIHRGSDDGPGCPVMLAHIIYNYDQLKEGNEKLKHALELLIPEDDKRCFNKQCAMFVEAAKVHHGPLPAHLKEWAKKQGLVELHNGQFAIKPTVELTAKRNG